MNAIDRIHGEKGESKSITISDDVWLGMNTVILKGVNIGKGTVIAANSVVTHSLPEGVLAAGIPAKIIKPLI